jgi:deoxycytidine triphosphate deaminase
MSIDLRKSQLLELSPRHYWKDIILRDEEYIEIKSGEFILGRVYEKFKMPENIAGKIEGRSSFGRLGLGVNINCDFINPGWKGHMPLQLVNYSKTTLKIYPYIPICQLILISLAEVPERIYGHQELQSKYMDDDGGPSYWWRDDRIKKLQKMFMEKDITLEIQEDILKKIGVTDIDIIYRFEKFADKLKKDEISNTIWILEKFKKSEKKKQRLEKFYIYGLPFIAGIFVSISIASYKLFITTLIFTILAFILNIIFICLVIYFLIFYDKKQFLTPEKIDDI